MNSGMPNSAEENIESMDGEVLNLLEQEVEQRDDFDSVEEMVESGTTKTLSVRVPVETFAQYEIFTGKQGYSSKSDGLKEAISAQMGSGNNHVVELDSELVEAYQSWNSDLDEEYGSINQAMVDGLRHMIENEERQSKLEQGWSTYLAGLNQKDPRVTALGIDTLYEIDETHGEIAESYMEPLLDKIDEDY